MSLLFSEPYVFLDSYMLIFIRVLGFMLITPVFSNSNVPQMVRAAFTFFLSLILVSSGSIVSPVSSQAVVEFAGTAVIEFATGLMIGFAVYIIYATLSLAGQFIDMQVGFSMVNVFDPMSQIQLTITGNLYYYLLIMVTLVTNAHHYILRGLVDSFEVIPLGGAVMTPALYDTMIQGMTVFFEIALKVASPIFMVMLITNVILGILARTVPQLNMFVVGFPIKILMGLATIFIMLRAFSMVSDMVISESEQLMRDVIFNMRPLE